MPRKGWTNVDSHTPADVQGDFRKMDFAHVEEVALIHTLEHIPYLDVIPTLKKIHGWMAPGGKITVEVPDMRQIAPQVDHPHWLLFVYGLQSHPGEFHRAGFTETTLSRCLEESGFERGEVHAFVARPGPPRMGMPCLEAVAYA